MQAELATHATVVLLAGVAEAPAGARAHGRRRRRDRQARSRVAGDDRGARPRARRAGATRWSSRRATPSSGEAEVVAVDDAVGRVSCESIAGYPPGIPALLPGERITAETVAYLRELVASGARLHGASDPAFGTIHVLA